MAAAGRCGRHPCGAGSQRRAPPLGAGDRRRAHGVLAPVRRGSIAARADSTAPRPPTPASPDRRGRAAASALWPAHRVRPRTRARAVDRARDERADWPLRAPADVRHSVGSLTRRVAAAGTARASRRDPCAALRLSRRRTPEATARRGRSHEAVTGARTRTMVAGRDRAERARQLRARSGGRPRSPEACRCASRSPGRRGRDR